MEVKTAEVNRGLMDRTDNANVNFASSLKSNILLTAVFNEIVGQTCLKKNISNIISVRYLMYIYFFPIRHPLLNDG